MVKQILGKSIAAVLSIAVVFLGVLGMAASQANAATPQSLTLCVKTGGVVFVVGEGFKKTDCKKNDQLISFSLSETGDKGPTGDQGAVGPTGAAGAVGSIGPIGDKGPTGDKGPQGDK